MAVKREEETPEVVKIVNIQVKQQKRKKSRRGKEEHPEKNQHELSSTLVIKKSEKYEFDPMEVLKYH